LSLSLTLAASSAYIADASPAQTRGTAMGLLGSIMDIGHSTGPAGGGHGHFRLWQCGRLLLFGSGRMAAGSVFAIHGLRAMKADRRL
jgi:hypothetical protein